ncbi:MAG: DUF5916 domain-containing protein [Gemmatimonadota bacterium]|nr:carbohydrate binding family 9 domain-containing protein [Gemmatimonadota bacterium]
MIDALRCRFRRFAPAAVLSVLSGLAALPGSAHAQDGGLSSPAPGEALPGRLAPGGGPEAQGIVDLPRLGGPVTLDGPSDEAAWADIPPFVLTMYEPTFRGDSERRVELRVAYDDEALYVAARFWHTDARDIRAFSLTRDRWSGDDSFGILLDTFNDNENALRFVGMPLGTRMDMSITGDGQQADGGGGGLGPRNNAWNTFWDLETRITEDGWHGEMRIPFSSLRFESGPDGSVVMGMMVYAYEPARGDRWTYPAIPRSYPYTQVSVWQDVRLRDVAPRTPIYLSPYALGSAERGTVLAGDESAFLGTSDRSVEFGGDLKINPTPNLTLDLTVNTDFAAVEADQQQVNLTRFSLFFEEKRPFFQERAGIFQFETGADRGTLFYSRRIGLADGAPVRILGGARLVGRLGAWDVGLIEMQTAGLDNLAAENFGVLRLRRRVLNANSFLGAMATSRIDADGGYNATYGVDGLFRLFGNEYVTLKWLQTLQGGDAVRDGLPGGLDAARLVLDWTRRQVEGLSYQHALTWSGPGYDPGIGFEPRSDFVRGQSDWSYQWFPTGASRLRRVWLGAQNNVWVRNADDRVDTGQLLPFLQLETKPGSSIKLSTTTLYEDVPLAFALSDDAQIPAGTYWATEGALELRSARGWTVRPNLTLRGGQFYDGTRVGVETDFTWPASAHLELGGGWEWNRIRFDERQQSFDSNLLRLRAQAAVDTRASMNAFIQYNSLSGQVSTNARFRYNFREGQDLWFVWNEGLNLDRDVVGLPRRPFEEARTLTVKYTHTLVF